MKKSLVIVALFILAMSFIIALENPEDDIGEEDVEKIEGFVDDIPIDPNTGEFDWGRFNSLATKAEVRINVINVWIDENMSWMRFVFRMTPAISFKFVLNIYFMLLFLVILVLNGSFMFSFLAEGKERYIGAAVYVALWIVNVYVNLAGFTIDLIIVIFGLIAGLGIFAVIAFVISLFATGGASLVYLQRAFYWLQKFLKAKKEARAARKTALHREVLSKIVKPLTSLRGSS